MTAESFLAPRAPARGAIPRAVITRRWRAGEAHTVNVSITVAPQGMSPAEVARYLAELESQLCRVLTDAEPDQLADLTCREAVAKQLQRLCQSGVTTAHRLRRLHEELLRLGFCARLPRSKRKEPPPYLSYVGPDGENLGYMRSRSFTVVRRELRETLLGVEGFAPSGAYLLTALTTDGAVDALIDAVRASTT